MKHVEVAGEWHRSTINRKSRLVRAALRLQQGGVDSGAVVGTCPFSSV